MKMTSKYDFFHCSDAVKEEALKSFLNSFDNKDSSRLKYSYGKTFFIEFDKSLLDSNAPLSFETYIHQINYFKNYFSCKNISYNEEKGTFTTIQSFYTFYQINYDNNVFEKDGYSTSLLVYPRTVSYILNDFHIINHNKLDKVPTYDKWLFCFYDSGISNKTSIKKIDFSLIENPTFRNFYKAYIWFLESKLSVEIKDFSRIKLFLNYIQAIKTQKVLSYFVEETTDSDKISVQEVKAFKYFIITNYPNKENQYAIFGTIRRFLKFLTTNNLIKLEYGIFLELSHIGRGNLSSNPNPINNTDLLLISNKMLEKSKDDNLYQLYHIIFYIALETEFRFSQICKLNVDCIKETAKHNQFVLVSQTKTSNQEFIEQPISIYIKKSIDEAIKITSKWRSENTNKELSNLLFIIPGVRKNTFTTLDHDKFNRVLAELCKELQINRIMVSNLRDTHMTLSENFIIKEQLSDVQLSVLSSHSSSFITDKHYTRLDIIEMLEASNKVIIGDVDLKGRIVKNIPSEINKTENLVSDSCGYCSASTCPINSDLSCLLCENFVTTISRKIYFEEQLKIIDSLIPTKVLAHDKEDLINRKRLFLKYIEEIINLEMENNNE